MISWTTTRLPLGIGDPFFEFTQNMVGGFNVQKNTIAVLIGLQPVSNRVWRKGSCFIREGRGGGGVGNGYADTGILV